MNKVKIFLQKHKLKRAYINYVMYIKSLHCGEELGLHISSTAFNLKKKLKYEHKNMCLLDKTCPPLKLNLIN